MKYTFMRLLLATVLLSILVCGSLFLFSITSYLRFRSQERRALPQFAALNEAVYAQIPPPSGAEEQSVFRDPVEIQEHGIHLSVDYQISGLSADEVLSYYENLLIPKGWQIDEPDSDESVTVYYRGSACIRLALYQDPNRAPESYHVTIYHDFLAQNFSPTPPPKWVLDAYDSFNTQMLRCPPSLGYP